MKNFQLIPAISPADHGVPPGLAGLPDSLRVRQLPGADHERAGRARSADAAESPALHHHAEGGAGQVEAGEPPGAERGGDRPRTVALPLQHRPVPRRQAHHVRAGRRADRVHAHGQHRLRCGRRRLHDPPQCSGHHGHAHLPSFALLPTDCGARGSRTQG